MREGVTDAVNTALPRWIPHASSTCAGVLPKRCSHRDDERVVEQSRFQRVPQRSERQQDDPFRLGIFMEIPLRVVRVRLDLHDRRLDPGGVDDASGSFDVDIGKADRPRKPVIDEGLHRGPGLRQGDSVVVGDSSVRVAGILVIARLERERRMHQVQIDGV